MEICTFFFFPKILLDCSAVKLASKVVEIWFLGIFRAKKVSKL